MVWFVDVTKTVNVVFRFVLVASTRSSRLAASYSARVTLTVSDAGGGVGFTVKLAVRVSRRQPFTYSHDGRCRYLAGRNVKCLLNRAGGNRRRRRHVNNSDIAAAQLHHHVAGRRVRPQTHYALRNCPACHW
jgi:hypothetical protein